MNGTSALVVESVDYADSLDKLLLELTVVDKKKIVLHICIILIKLMQRGDLFPFTLSDFAITNKDGKLTAYYKMWQLPKEKGTLQDVYRSLSDIMLDIFVKWKVYDEEMKELQETCKQEGF